MDDPNVDHVAPRLSLHLEAQDMQRKLRTDFKP